MSWRHTEPMKERLAFVAELERSERTMSELCRVFNVSRKTGHKWAARYREEGVTGLVEHSRAAHEHPNAMCPEVARRLLELRARHPDWGPLKLLDWLGPRAPELRLPAASTAAELLKRHGMIKVRARTRHSVPYGAPFVQAVAPNELWGADFKGQFRLGEGRLCYPLTLSDAASRFLLCCRALERPTYAHTQLWLKRVFHHYGLPAAIRTDNGAPFASTALGGISRLSLWWLKLGIVPERIRPGHPEQNGRHERLHGTLKRACPVRGNLPAQQRAFDAFRRTYNTERPHQALHGHTPHSHYQPSHRPYPSKLPELSYPAGYVVRRVSPAGTIGWLGRRWYVAGVLHGEPIGLYPIDNELWRVHVGMLAIGELHARAKRIEPIETMIEIPTIH